MNASLDDVYTVRQGPVYMTGIQALVRLPMLQHERVSAAGLNTAGFISGYRGSPLGGYDMALWRNKSRLDARNIRFLPAINEEMAATAVIGTQQLDWYGDSAYDGVFAIWYGKGPGLDRAGDALKHANHIGTAPHGGALIVVGDDHGAVSSALAHQGEQLMASWMVPVLNPANVQDYLDYGLYGFAMSRFSGCYVGFKAITETVETAGVVTLDTRQPSITLPQNIALPPGGLHSRWPDPQLVAEDRLQNYKLPAVLAFARANRLDRRVFGPADARYGLITTGKAHLDVLQALADLGIDEARARDIGLAIYKIALSWPLETEGATAFAAGCNEVFVVEEKRSFVEAQLKDALYHLPADQRPRVVGKTDETGAPLLPGTGELRPDMIAAVLARRLPDITPEEAARASAGGADAPRSNAGPPPAVRAPFFCSGCPHNRSTAPLEGSRSLAGTGCHLMAAFMNRDTTSFLHMGCEGVNWVGQAPFSKTRHVFQNLGDGTFTHSGSLAIRQAIAAGVNITYKILYNDAVAMTGGQPLEGGMTVPQITRLVHNEGARRIVVVTDEPDKYPVNAGFAPGVTVHHRDELQALEREFRDIPGVTVIVYDQVCAAEKRRRRKRGLYPDPPKRAFINERVCEGCGDCVVKSNCISVVPKDTPLGRKRMIDQSSCNKDFSCITGFCPSFVTVHGGEITRAAQGDTGRLDQAIAALPAPAPASIGPSYGILVTGIGGTGVITIGQLIGMAAHLDGHGCSVLDFTGLAQKGGGVLSHVRVTESRDTALPARLPLGRADLLLVGDEVVAVGREAMARLHPGTRAVINSTVTATAASILDPDAALDTTLLRRTLVGALGEANAHFIDATGIATKLMGDSITANIFALGYACQAGFLPVSLKAMLKAIELNGVAVEANIRCFNYGRLAADDPALMRKLVGPLDSGAPHPGETLEQIITRRADFLTAYQNRRYAERYRALVERARQAETGVAGAPGPFSEAVARSFFKLMADKDEYEVARLFTDGAFIDQLKEQFTGDFKLRFHMAPPLISRRDPQSGELQKSTFGPWVFHAFKVLARLKGLRGTPFDIFGHTAERRGERALIGDYEKLVGELSAALTAQNRPLAAEIAGLALKTRGYGHVRARNLAMVMAEREKLLEKFRAPPEAAASTRASG